MHLKQYFKVFGPCYLWWLFPYMHFNGILEQVELNYHPDSVNTSLAQWWIRTHQLHNYIGVSYPSMFTDTYKSVNLLA
jgi:hypothetical protein